MAKCREKGLGVDKPQISGGEEQTKVNGSRKGVSLQGNWQGEEACSSALDTAGFRRNCCYRDHQGSPTTLRVSPSSFLLFILHLLSIC